MTQTDQPPSPRDVEGRDRDAFVLVSPALVRRVGNGNAAILFARIEFRCNQPGDGRIEDETGRWWRVAMNALSDETGLTVDAIRRALRNLEKMGAVESRKHRMYGPSDQTFSYRTTSPPAIRSNAHIDSGETPNGSSTVRSNAHIDSVKRPHHHSVKRPNVPSLEEEKERGAHASVFEVVPTWESEPPPPRCPKHINDPNPPNCHACGQARTARADWDSEQRRRNAELRSTEAHLEAQRRAEEILDCDLCDEFGYRGRSVCTHNPDQAATNARGAARVRAALDEKRRA